MIGIEKGTKSHENAHLSQGDVEAQRWVAALTLTGLLMTLLMIAGLHAATTHPDIDQTCFRTKMDDESTLLKASFQSPADQDAIVEAMRACTR
ncbi:hypothetical protein P3T18_000259 [Paraburkholderia sp. GAS199]|uniref:hypothetical protein n=1 Tax=Paraburkholderia sp. GAS199 TaxID=3035126 RepID=UPI003D2357AD